MLYYHETLQVLPGKMREYLDMLSKTMVELNSPRGREFIGLWRPETGWLDVVLAILVVDGWHKLEQAHGTPSKADEKMSEYRRIAGQWRQDFEVRLLDPIPICPSLETQLTLFFQSKLFIHDTVVPYYGKEQEYYQVLAKELVPACEKHGIKLYGVWRNVFAGREIIQMWSIADHNAYARFRSAVGQDKQIQEWAQKAATLRQRVSTQLLQSVPFVR